jgi:hypothetical protein
VRHVVIHLRTDATTRAARALQLCYSTRRPGAVEAG